MHGSYLVSYLRIKTDCCDSWIKNYITDSYSHLLKFVDVLWQCVLLIINVHKLSKWVYLIILLAYIPRQSPVWLLNRCFVQIKHNNQTSHCYVTGKDQYTFACCHYLSLCYFYCFIQLPAVCQASNRKLHFSIYGKKGDAKVSDGVSIHAASLFGFNGFHFAGYSGFVEF